MTALSTLQSIIASGESETLEFKRSTAELQRAGQTLCAFLNGDGGPKSPKQHYRTTAMGREATKRGGAS